MLQCEQHLSPQGRGEHEMRGRNCADLHFIRRWITSLGEGGGDKQGTWLPLIIMALPKCDDTLWVWSRHTNFQRVSWVHRTSSTFFVFTSNFKLHYESSETSERNRWSSCIPSRLRNHCHTGEAAPTNWKIRSHYNGIGLRWQHLYSLQTCGHSKPLSIRVNS